MEDTPPGGDTREEGRGGGRGGRFRTRVYRRKPDGEQGDQQLPPRGPPVRFHIMLCNNLSRPFF